MLVSVAMLAGLLIGGVVVYVATQKHAAAAVWTALAMGVVADVVLLGMLNEWFLPRAGMFEAVGVALLSGIATALAIGCLVRGERKALNWVALAFAAPPVIFLVIFGLGNLFSPAV